MTDDGFGIIVNQKRLTIVGEPSPVDMMIVPYTTVPVHHKSRRDTKYSRPVIEEYLTSPP